MQHGHPAAEKSPMSSTALIGRRQKVVGNPEVKVGFWPGM